MAAAGTEPRRLVRRHRRLAPWLVVIGLALLVRPAVAAEFVTVEDECRGRQLLLQGPIEPGDHAALIGHMAALVHGNLPDVQDPDRLWTVLLDSPGGDLDEAMRMGRFLRRAFATTEVSYRYAQRPDGVYDFQRSAESVCLGGEGRLSGCHPDLVEAECTGACLLIWLGGVERRANEGRLGLHGLAGGGVDDYLGELGWADARIDTLQAAAGGDGWLPWPARHELSRPAAALDTLLADCPAPLDADESYRAVTAPSADERDRLMDRADAHRGCRRARVAGARAAVVAKLQRAGAAAPSIAGAPD